MDWDAIFGITNVVALIGHVVLALWSRTPRTLSTILYLGIGLLCLTYAILLALLVGGVVDPGKVTGAVKPDLLDYSIAGLRSMFMSDAGIVIGWTHYLAFDLFVARWIAIDADAKGVGRATQLPFLFLTFMAGPVGLLSWLVYRRAPWLNRQSGK